MKTFAVATFNPFSGENNIRCIIAKDAEDALKQILRLDGWNVYEGPIEKTLSEVADYVYSEPMEIL